MMISPKTYYELYLKDKDEKEIIRKINELKKEIKELKHTMEHPNYRPTINPDEATQLWCNRLYLEQAKQALEAIGGTYTPTNKEILAKKFNENIPFIKTIEYESDSYLDGFKNITIFFDETNTTMEISDFFNHHSPTKIHIDKEEFLDEFRMLDIGEWERTYYESKYGLITLDGINWKLTITFHNGHKTKRIIGTNAFPYNYNQFIELLENTEMEHSFTYTISEEIKNDIIYRMISKIKELPLETEISTSQLLSLISNKSEYNGNYIYDDIILTFNDMMTLNAEFKIAAKKEGIIIDDTIHDGEILGLLFNIEFKIIHY